MHKQLSDVAREMKKIFRQHLSQKRMTEELILAAIKNFIAEFDPYHIYFTADEIATLQSYSKEQVKHFLADYRSGKYKIFEKLNQSIRRAIGKMRRRRKKMRARISEAMLREVYAQDQGELERWHGRYFRSVGEKSLREHEARYLSDDKSLFALHLLQAFTAALDAHSQYRSVEMARKRAMKLEKQYVGIGISFREEGDRFFVSSLVKDASAEKSGKIRKGDEILEIDGKKVAQKSSQELLDRLQGSEGGVVKLLIRRKRSPPFLVELARERVTLQEGRAETSFARIKGGIIGCIKLHGFYEGTGIVSSEIDLRIAIQALKSRGKLMGLMLDLRDNQGGLLSQAIKVAGIFLKTGVIVVARDASDNLFYFRTLYPEAGYRGPLVVLISRKSASAAEIVAQALKDYGVAIIVGDEQSYGKGSLQVETSPTTSITIGKYYSVSGHSTQAGGVRADIVVPGPYADLPVSKEEPEETIAPSFEDTLGDIPPEQMAWYREHYLPHRQKRRHKYRKAINELKEQSEQRQKRHKKKRTTKPETLAEIQFQEAAHITKALVKKYS